MELDQVITEFVADLKLAGRATWTIKKHSLELARFQRWAVEQGHNWQQMGAAQLRQYTRTKAHLGHSSRSNMLCTLRTFYRWAVEQEYIAHSPAASLKTPRRPRPLPRALTLSQVRKVVAYLQSCEGRTAHRDQVLLITALYAGLRACELARLCWADVDLCANVINIKLTKGNKGRSVPIHAELEVQLRQWRAEQAGAEHWPCFSLDGGALVAARIGKIARRVSRLSNVKFTAHVLRHTFATWSLRRSGNLYAVSKALGHAQVAQTEIYVSADPELLRNAVATLPALDAW